MALRGQIINDTQPFCSLREHDHIVGRHTHRHKYTPLLTQVFFCSVVAVTLRQSEAVLWLIGQSLSTALYMQYQDVLGKGAVQQIHFFSMT